MARGKAGVQKKWFSYDQRLCELCHRQTEKNSVEWCDLHFDLFESWANRRLRCFVGEFEEVPVLNPGTNCYQVASSGKRHL